MKKKNYIVINGVKYYPVFNKNLMICDYCSFYDDDKCDCKLKKIGIRCRVNSYFVKGFELNQKVLVALPFNNQHIWRRDIYLNYEKETKMHCTFYEKAVPDNLIIPYDKDKDGKQVPYENYH